MKTRLGFDNIKKTSTNIHETTKKEKKKKRKQHSINIHFSISLLKSVNVGNPHVLADLVVISNFSVELLCTT